jgi:hypothetical protein
VSTDRPTKEMVRAEERDTVEAYLDARAEVLRIASEVRTIGLGMQADRLEAVAAVLAPPSYRGILAALETRHPTVSAKQAEFLVAWLEEAADIIRDLREDAEITGSTDALSRSAKWLDRLGL